MANRYRITSYQSQLEAQARAQVWAKVWSFVGGACATLLIAIVIAVVAIEWLAGCGEVTYYADRTWETNQCVFQDNKIERGTW